eukprot:GHVL01024077.1.p1 GENE.GHVL01024077.1~~GHVL01024077.1.p1  ORF type:complete len:722 (-),score=109.43 GHVL01024077.1:972-3137(-)
MQLLRATVAGLVIALSLCINTESFISTPGPVKPRCRGLSSIVAPEVPSCTSSSIEESRSEVLDTIRSPNDMKHLSIEDLKALSQELRSEILNAVSKTGGHLSSSLGVVELTVALHKVFETPEDRIIWDVSHQCYPHKILTGRRDRMHTLRMKGGLSGFTKRAESEYDPFGAGHSSTSISAAQGMSVAKEFLGKKRNNCVAVIGDGGLTGGMAYEAMNSCGFLNNRLIVVLNDNGQVSLPTGNPSAGGTAPSGALSAYSARLLSSRTYKDFRNVAKELSKLFPKEIQNAASKIDDFSRRAISGDKATLFEELGFYYIGPVDGHDLDNLVPILENLRDSTHRKPVLLHVKTEKGRGYAPALSASDKMHGVVKFDVVSGKQFKATGGAPAYTNVFANTLINIARDDPKVVGITAAMPGGTGMGSFGKAHPSKMFDVGIGEQHAVTFAAGMAAEGLIPFCAIYSTFLQRGYDQVVHDVAVQNLPVRLIVDRAGLVGQDGPTHHGTFDLAYLGALPNMIIMAPSDEIELMNMIQTAYETNDHPTVVRYPRGSGLGFEKLRDANMYKGNEMPKDGVRLDIGKGRIVKAADVKKQKRVAILCLGSMLHSSVLAARELELDPNVGVTVADARFMKPLDKDMIKELVKNHDALITIEEGSVGGFGSHVMQFLTSEGLLDDGKIKIRAMVIPDKNIEAASQSEQMEEVGLTTKDIVNLAKTLYPKNTYIPK